LSVFESRHTFVAVADESPWRKLWTLEPDLAFLNHGSFGACPRAVLDAQSAFRERMEREPVRFFVRDLEKLLDAARGALAAFLRAEPSDLSFVPNATAGVNAVLGSFPFAPGDEILVTNHAYNACRNACEYAAKRAGASVVVATVPFPLRSPDEVVEALLAHVGPKTRLALVDHVTSPTGLVWPVERIVPALAERGVETIVDGAHAPGMLDVDLSSIGAAFYAGNCHKWLCAPKGAGFLHVRRDRQPWVRPHVISHGANSPRTDRSRFLIEFDWTGTADPTAYLTVPAAIDFLGSLLPGGWPELRARNRALALAARERVRRTLGVAAPAPDEMIGSLATVPFLELPAGAPVPPYAALGFDPLQIRLSDEHRIQVPCFYWLPPAGASGPILRMVRMSAQLYNTVDEYERLAVVLRAVVDEERAGGGDPAATGH
jgi:isopenicillin-N epimerase